MARMSGTTADTTAPDGNRSQRRARSERAAPGSMCSRTWPM